MKNYFDIFGLNIDFKIDKKQLKTIFKEKIVEFHPDKFTNANSSEKITSIQNTALINTAFNTLNSNLLRATYLLELQNINAFNEKDTQMNGEFLMQMIEMQESLAELKDEFEIDEFIDNIDLKIKNNVVNLTNSFQSDDLLQAKNLVRELKFYEQTKSRANDKIE